MLRWLTGGESHGRGLAVILEGVPAGLELRAEAVQRELARRRLGYGRGPRMRFEEDRLSILGGVRHGRTLGSPIVIEIANSEWERKWTEEMSPEPGVTARRLTAPRPGHADLAGMQKYGFDDARNVLERASARETAARVAAGAVAKALLGEIGVAILSHVVQLGSVKVTLDRLPTLEDLDRIDSSQVRCLDGEAEELMVAAVRAAAKEGDSLGGAVQVIAHGVPVGLGSYVHWDRRLDGRIAQALVSIPAVKAVSVGEGVEIAGLRGSLAHDAIVGPSLRRATDRAGGVEGGVSNGEPVVATAWMKPLATLNRPVIETVDLATGQSTRSFRERTDVTAVPAMGVVAEAMLALVLADEALRKFGGDSLTEFVRNTTAYLGHEARLPWREGSARS